MKKQNEEVYETIVKIQDLVGEIEYLNDEYRQGTPQVSDQEYDKKLEELALLDPQNPILKKGIIEGVKDDPRKRKLQTPMMSLNKEKSVPAIKAWLKKNHISDEEVLVITPKLNGISLLSVLNYASTRGDGEYGRSCDQHLKLINNGINRKIGVLNSGEAIISRKNWKEHFEGKLNPRTGDPYKLNNATVAGMLNCDEPPKELKYVDFIRYNLHNENAKNFDKIEHLRTVSFDDHTSIFFYTCKVSELDEIQLDSFYQHQNQFYPIDGLVIDINDYVLRNKLGREENGNPAYARALKLDKWVEEFDTEITGYDFTISKQGKLKGVVTFNPILINGTEVKQATFYNAKFLYSFHLFPGMKITVKKSGEIIPRIVAVEGIHIPIASEYKVNTKQYDIDCAIAEDQIAHISEEKTNTIGDPGLDICPSCKKDLTWDETNTELCCTNEFCKKMLISKIEHFFISIGVEEFGRPSIETLYKNGYDSIETIWDITKEELEVIEGFGEASADIILGQFEKVKKAGVPFAKLLYAWDVFEGKIGEKTAQLIFDNVDEYKNVTIEDLVKIKGISNTTAECFIKGYNAWIQLPPLIKISYIQTPTKAVTGDKNKGFNVCFSGIRDKDLEEQITSNGGSIASGVSKMLTHLIVADVNQSTSKTVKAKELGCKVLTIEQFKNL